MKQTLKSLYESIMKNVAKVVKKKINESYDSFSDATYNVNKLIQDLPDEVNKIELATAIGDVLKLLRDTLNPVLEYKFKNNSLEEESIISFEHNILRAILDITNYNY